MSTNNKRLVNIDNRTWTPEDVHYWINPEDGTVNAVIMFDGKKTRLRAGILILNNKDEILMTHEGGEADGELSLPGGGLEIDETPKAAGEREAQEEVHMDTKNLIDTGFDYCEVYDEVKQWVKDHVPEEEWWYNYYTCLILGRYDGEYEGKVAKVDEDPHVLNSARWRKLEDVIHNPTFKEQWKKAILKYVPELRDRLKEAITESLKTPLTEDTRNQLVAKSRTAGPYKNQERGKNRFERKKFSKIATQVKSYNQIDMDQFFKQDILEMTIPVTGETNNYDVVIKIDGVLEEIRRNIKANKNTFEYRTVLQALTKMFNMSNIYVKCSCDDFRYNFDHWSIVNQYSANDSASDPGPGKGIANPNDDKGIGCKHILLALANAGWIMHVASVINNYIHYAENNMQKAFLALIFPKLYDIPASAAVEQGLVPEDTKIETTKDIIDVINKYGKDRGKIKPGTNTNPVTGTGPNTKFPEKEREEPEKEKPAEKKPTEQKPEEKPEEKKPSAKPAEKDKEKPADDTTEKAS